MGWLKGAMEEAGVRNYADLAGRLLEHPDLPEAARLKVKPLGNQLGKLDRGIELTWWTQRPGADVVLADVLGVDLAQVHTALDVPTAQIRGAQYGLDAIPDARKIDLANEDPFPGIPRHLKSKYGSKHVWWTEPTGMARDFMGRWLAQRGYTRIVVRDWDELTERVRTVPDGSDVFAEVTAPAVLPPAPERPFWDRVATSSAEDGRWPTPDGVRLIVATSIRLENGPFEIGDFREEFTRPAEEWLEDLVRWLAARLPGFDADPAIELFSRVKLGEHVESPADALALCGVIHHVGIDVLDRVYRKEGVLGWVQPYLKTVFQVREGTPLTSTANLLRTRGREVLEGALRAAMKEGADPFAPHLRGEWQSWMPSNVVPEPDVDAAARMLAAASPSLDAGSVRELRERLQPGPAQVLAALSAARVLRDDRDSDALVMQPNWIVAAMAESIAAAALAGESPEWGALALNPDLFGGVVERRVEYAMAGGRAPFFQAMRNLEIGDPASMMAFDIAFRAAGLACVAGQTIEADLAVRLCEIAVTVSPTLHAEEGPRPLFDRTDADSNPFGHWALWRLAWLALSEQAKRPIPGSSRHLAPWHRADGEATQTLVLAGGAIPGVQAPVGDDTDPIWSSIRRGAARLARRLAVAGLSVRSAVALGAPGAIVDAVMSEQVPKDADVDQLARMEEPFLLLRDAAEDRGQRLETIVGRLWSMSPIGVLDGSHNAAFQWVLIKGAHDIPLLWKACPPDVLANAQLCDQVVRDRAYEHFDGDQWIAFLRERSGRTYVASDGIWSRAPAAAVQATINAIGVPNVLSGDAEAIWRAAPEQTLRAVVRQTDREAGVLRVLLHAPQEMNLRLVGAYERQTPARVDVWRRWLHYLVSTRKAGWREAFSLLARDLPVHPAV